MSHTDALRELVRAIDEHNALCSMQGQPEVWGKKYATAEDLHNALRASSENCEQMFAMAKRALL